MPYPMQKETMITDVMVNLYEMGFSDSTWNTMSVIKIPAMTSNNHPTKSYMRFSPKLDLYNLKSVFIDYGTSVSGISSSR